MVEDSKTIEKLGKWVKDHPEEADVKHIDLTTQKEFTIRDVLYQMEREQKLGVAMADETMSRAKKNIAEWLGG